MFCIYAVENIESITGFKEQLHVINIEETTRYECYARNVAGIGKSITSSIFVAEIEGNFVKKIVLFFPNYTRV